MIKETKNVDMMWPENWQLQKLYLADYLGQLYSERSEPFLSCYRYYCRPYLV
jgi:hypothetical protein